MGDNFFDILSTHIHSMDQSLLDSVDYIVISDDAYKSMVDKYNDRYGYKRKAFEAQKRKM